MKTTTKNHIQSLRLCMLIALLFTCEVSLASTDTSYSSSDKPVVGTSSLCVNTALVIQSVSPKVERIVWKHNRQEAGVFYTPTPIRTIAGGKEGVQDDEFRFPAGIAVDKAGNIYVADQFNHRVQMWAPGAKEGITVAGVYCQGDAADQLNYPMGVAVDAKGNLYVSDAANSRIQMFVPGSVVGITVAGGHGRGSASNQLNMPFGICLDEQGNIYVADNYNHRIQKWAPGAVSGVTVAGGNGKGKGANQLQYPTSVKTDDEDAVFIADAANDRVQMWQAGAKTGITIAGGNGRGVGQDQLYYPTDIALDAKGDLLIADETNQRIQYWKKGAKTGITVAGGNGLGNAMNQFAYPYGLVVDKDDNMYVADQFNHRIQFFQNPESPIRYTFQFKASRPGTYQADIVYRNGKVEKSDSIEIHDLPVIDSIVAEEIVCTGKQYQFKTASKAGIWLSSNHAVAEIDATGILTAKQHGTVVVSYQIQDTFGCVNKVATTIKIKPAPEVPPVMLAPEIIQQSGSASVNGQQFCVGTRWPLNTMLQNGKWNSSDTNIVKVVAGNIHGVGAGEAVVSYTVEKDGCVAEGKASFTVVKANNAPIIQGYNKIVAGQIRQFSVGSVQGKWSSQQEEVADIDQRGYAKAIRPGLTHISFETTDQQGCKVQASIPLTIQPEAPIVKDAFYASNELAAFYRIDQQVKAKAGNQLQFFETASPNAVAIDPMVKNTPGTYRFWVAQVENGIASQRVAFSVNITQTSTSEKLSPVVMGNPATNFFTVQLKSVQADQPVAMRVLDMQGRVIEQRQTLTVNSTIQFGQSYPSGQYVVEWVQGRERKVQQLIKLGTGRKDVSYELLAASPK